MAQKQVNPVVTLVKAWEVFEEENPEGDIESFCQDYLKKQQIKRFQQADERYISHPALPQPRPSDGLGKALVRVHKFLHFYAKKTMQNLPVVDNFEDFAYLAELHIVGAMRKSELIQRNISEFTSGTNVINRLLKNNLIEEFNDPDDARSKQVKITQAGIEWIMSCLPAMVKVDMLLLGHLPSDEREVLFHILSKIDHYHTRLYHDLKGMSIEEILKIYKQIKG